MTAQALRLSNFADELKKAGVAGESMQAVLDKVAEREDLTADEINRVAEMANRNVQLELHKTSSNKRFKFEVADPSKTRTHARKKSAEWQALPEATDTEKLAAAINDAGGDPFAAPHRQTETSLTGYRITDDQAEKLAFDIQEKQDREALFALDESRIKLELLEKTANFEVARLSDSAESHRKDLIQAAMDMIEHAVTLPDLYAACYAAGAGSDIDQANHLRNVNNLMGMVIEGLKERGMPAYRMGFRDYGNPEKLEAMSTEDWLKHCMMVSGYGDMSVQNTFTMQEAKGASVEKDAAMTYSEAHTADQPIDFWSDQTNDPVKILMNRPSVKDYKIPQFRVDQAKNHVRVFNSNHPFIISVENLIGDRSRMVQLHGAQEYLGLKLKQIEEAISALSGVRAARLASVKA